jgi:hypothetical protein
MGLPTTLPGKPASVLVTSLFDALFYPALFKLGVFHQLRENIEAGTIFPEQTDKIILSFLGALGIGPVLSFRRKILNRETSGIRPLIKIEALYFVSAIISHEGQSGEHFSNLIRPGRHVFVAFPQDFRVGDSIG